MPASPEEAVLRQRIVRLESFLEGVAEIAHDLRNAMAVIRGSSELLVEVDLDQTETKYYAGAILEETTQLARMAQDMLDLARLELGRYSFARRAIDLTSLLYEAAADAVPASADRSFQVIAPADARLVWVDPIAMYQATRNLFGYAYIVAAGNGTVELRESADNTYTVLVQVPLAAAVAPVSQVDFDPFLICRAFGGKNAKMALAFCKSIVEAHDGAIWVETQAADSVTFAFRLPASLSETPDGPLG